MISWSGQTKQNFCKLWQNHLKNLCRRKQEQDKFVYCVFLHFTLLFIFFVCIPWLAFNCKNTFNPLIKWPAGRMRDPESGGQVWKSRAIAWVFLFALQLNLIAFWRVINPKQWQPKNYAPPSASIVLSLTHWLHLFSPSPDSEAEQIAVCKARQNVTID